MEYDSVRSLEYLYRVINAVRTREREICYLCLANSNSRRIHILSFVMQQISLCISASDISEREKYQSEAFENSGYSCSLDAKAA